MEPADSIVRIDNTSRNRVSIVGVEKVLINIKITV